MQQCTAELDTAVNNGRTANEQLQKLRGEASVLQLWQQNVQAERAAEIEAVKTAKQVIHSSCRSPSSPSPLPHLLLLLVLFPLLLLLNCC